MNNVYNINDILTVCRYSKLFYSIVYPNSQDKDPGASLFSYIVANYLNYEVVHKDLIDKSPVAQQYNECISFIESFDVLCIVCNFLNQMVEHESFDKIIDKSIYLEASVDLENIIENVQDIDNTKIQLSSQEIYDISTHIMKCQNLLSLVISEN